MRPIGGELALHDELAYLFTDSGRSSLRLFCRNFPGKKIVLPDFLCAVITDVLEEEGMPYAFYRVNEDFSVDVSSLSADFDVLYIINYFGMKQNLPLEVNEKIIIEDNVFFMDFANHRNYSYWFAFNSYRKITALADGSMIKTNLPLQVLRTGHTAPFSALKYEAKELKYNYLTYAQGSEAAYLSKFEAAEKILDHQSDICTMSDKSLGQLNSYLTCYQNEKTVRERNYATMVNELGALCVGIESDFYSYGIILTEERDALRKYLFSKNIFLPVHWPESKGGNILHKKILSLPLFYTQDEMNYLLTSIKEYYEKN